jgi:hypothetical protein
MSLLDAGLHGDHAGVFIDSEAMFNEDMFGYSALRARIGARGRPSKRLLSIIIESIVLLL